ncbi:MAG: hypothetical protein ABR584_12270 [Candidatus Baltobacteraceae bacterium]
MKFFAALLSIACFSTGISASAVASQTHSAKPKAVAHAPKKAAAPAIRVAPADEYFGRLKMSILGIRNTLKDLAQKADYNPSNSEQIFGSANFMEEALREWEHKYPSDPWLAKSVAGLVHMYSRVATASGREKMHAAMDWLQRRYGKTKSLVAAEKAEVEAADKAPVAPAEAATAAPVSGTPVAIPAASSNAPAAQATNAPAPAAKPPARP